MSHQHRTLSAITGRATLVLLLVCALGPLAHASGDSASTRSAPAATNVARNVRAALSGEATRIIITGTAPMAYTVRRPDESKVVVELPGVDASRLAPAYHFASPLVAGVAVKQAVRAGGERVASLEVDLRAPARERSRLDGNELVLELRPAAKDAAAPAAEVTAKAAALVAPATVAANDPPTAPAVETAQNPVASQTPMPPPSQGQQYGQPGFVGEPINLNVVNADVRDILNYITEQYGVNFVVDRSVEKVPVTVNVTEVPWNFALDSILKANRLGVEVSGNILRIATTTVLAQESNERAVEANARTKLREAQLNNSPLVTEFIRLNYARAVGTLAGAAGSTGGFSGGSTNQSFSGGAGGDATGGGGDAGILPIVSRRLSRRGSVEVDGRSNTLIITDVRENIDAIRQLVTLLDQPEPQVEIETRIVIATRNFSRDLGVQLGATVINPNRGGLGSFSTLPSVGDRTTGPNAFGTPGGLAQTTQATDALRATAASTVIGLTTGLIGTAQISALITAAETRGQAKIVATPRVTALNNRPAQIESGSQIPVVTPQSGTSGASSVFTTTFVAVPLRLSITPQITDAGTVILRVVMENNSVNGALTNSLGTPGIDTQRMQTEVLVPDGGTTVVGGVLNDRESDTQNRTPGLGGIPLLGNLFKRKAAVRNTDEILFFITPRIYRPDYQGRRTDSAVTTGTRSVQLPQPVPLGNPPTNTPSPTAPAQQQQQPTPQDSTQPAADAPQARPATDAPEARPDAATGVRP